MKPWKKYLIEFVVIVVGILTAISLENWNQERIQKNDEIELVEQLLADAIEDTIFYNTRLVGLIGLDTTLNNLIILSSNSNNDSLLSAIPQQVYGKFAYQSNLIYNNPGAYDKLSNRMIKKEFRLLNSRYEYTSKSMELFNDMNKDFTLDIMLEMVERSIFLKTKSHTKIMNLCSKTVKPWRKWSCYRALH